MNVLEVKDVYKRLGKREIIKGITFNVESGHIYGFLGPNGAGKTTTIRMIVGLIAANKGSIKIMGHDIKKEPGKALKYVGSVVENPELYTYLTAKENLEQLARMYKDIPKERIGEVLELVRIKDRMNDKVRKYSLGMKQRLGLAEAIFAKPKLLILDEPTNGLDPMGIRELRAILRKLAKEEGTAIFISSHILAEIEQVCDTVAFIDKGVIKSVESINKDDKESTEHFILSVKENEKAEEVLKNISIVKLFKKLENSFSVILEKDSSSQLVKELVKKDVAIKEIYKKQQGLEERFMEIVSEGGDN